MAVYTNKVTIKDDVSGYIGTETASRLTANRAYKKQDRGGVIADTQNIQNNIAGGPGYKIFSTAADNNITIRDDNNLSPTKSISILTTFRRTDLTKLSILFDKSSAASAKEYVVVVYADGSVAMALYSTDGSHFIAATTAAGLISDTETHTLLCTHDGTIGSGSQNNFKIYLDGVDIPYTGSISGSYTGRLNLASVVRIGSNTASASYPQVAYRAVLFNYALTNTNKISRYSDGGKIDFEDVGASESDFIKTGAWGNLGLGSFSSTSETNFSGSVSATGQGAYKTFNGTDRVWVKGKRYRFTLTSAEAREITIELLDSVGNYTQSVVTSFGAGETKDIEILHTPIYGAATRYNIVANTVGSGTMTISNIKLIKLGAVLVLDQDGMTGSVWRDSSGNNLHATTPGVELQNASKLLNTESGVVATVHNTLDSITEEGYYFGGGTKYLEIVDNDVLSIESPMTTITTITPTTNTGLNWLFAKGEVGDREYDLRFDIDSLNLLYARFTASTNASISALYKFKATDLDKVTAIATRYDGSFTKEGIDLFKDGFLLPVTRDFSGTYAGLENTTIPLRLGSMYGHPEYYKGHFHRHLHFNYALTDAQISKYSLGHKLEFIDIGGHRISNNTFTTAVLAFNSFTSASGAAWSGTHNATENRTAETNIGLVVKGKKYRLTFTSGWTGSILNTYIRNSSAGTSVSADSGVTSVTSGTKTSITLEVTTAPSDPTQEWVIVIAAEDAVTYSMTNIVVEQLGAILTLEPDNISPSMWFDDSSNNLDAVVNGVTAINCNKSLSIRRVTALADVASPGTALITVPTSVESFDIDVTIKSGTKYARIKGEGLRINSAWELGNFTAMGDSTLTPALYIDDSTNVLSCDIASGNTGTATWTFTPKDI